MTQLEPAYIKQLLSRLPQFELSYETISHKKVSSEYTVCLAIPQSKKFYAYFSFHLGQDVCYLMELTREKKIGNISIAQTLFHPSLSLGTLLYGSLIESSPSKYHFLVEDMFYYKGISLRNTTFGHKLGFIYEFMRNTIVQKFDDSEPNIQYNIVFTLPVMWGIDPTVADDPTNAPTYALIIDSVTYPIHHLQYRSLTTICPFLNVFINKLNLTEPIATVVQADQISAEYFIDTTKKYTPDFTKPQYNQKTVFLVCADLQNDIYHLYAYGKNSELIYYDYAYIPNYRVSVFMNGLFRNIKENVNLDSIEESDDESDFQDIQCDKYVDLTKKIFIECTFNKKFKRWTPICTVDGYNAKVIHISKLIRGTIGSPGRPLLL